MVMTLWLAKAPDNMWIGVLKATMKYIYSEGEKAMWHFFWKFCWWVKRMTKIPKILQMALRTKHGEENQIWFHRDELLYSYLLWNKRTLITRLSWADCHQSQDSALLHRCRDAKPLVQSNQTALHKYFQAVYDRTRPRATDRSRIDHRATLYCIFWLLALQHQCGQRGF